MEREIGLEVVIVDEVVVTVKVKDPKGEEGQIKRTVSLQEQGTKRSVTRRRIMSSVEAYAKLLADELSVYGRKERRDGVQS